jgi:hypothetical protein
VTWGDLNAFKVMYTVFNTKPLIFLALAFLSAISVIVTILTVQLLYGKHMFNWDSSLVGFYLATSTGCRGLGLLVLLPLAIKYTKHIPNFDYYLTQLALITATLQFVVNGLWRTTLGTFLICIPGLVSAWIAPLLRALLSHRVRESEQGRLFGCVGVIEACLASLIGSTAFNKTYSSTVDDAPYAFNLLAAGMFALGVVAMLFFKLFDRPADQALVQQGINDDPRKGSYDETKPLLGEVGLVFE